MNTREGGRRIFTLMEVTRSIQRTLMDRYGSAFWVKAEINKLNYYPGSGHCFPELVEKVDGRILAQMKANLWKSDYEEINSKFKAILREPLKDGIVVLMLVNIVFDPSFGLSLRIVDMDPSFSLGELEREKQEAIRRLKEEGLFDLNRSRELPMLPKRIAVISVASSKGYADFMKVLHENPWGYVFFTHLYPAILQGDSSAASIIHQLARIEKVKQYFDAVAIVRGGGGDVGLSSYNHYALARAVSSFPLPVLSGIGHSTNETVTELVSYRFAITPTELADFLIQKFHDFAVPVRNAVDILLYGSRRILSEASREFQSGVRYFRSVSQARLSQGSLALDALVGDLEDRTRKKLAQERRDLHHLEKSFQLMDPARILERGFSITFADGKVVKRSGEVVPGAVIKTQLSEGEIVSKVQS